MKRIWQYCRPMKGKIIVEMLVKFSGTVMDLLLPLILSHIIDEVVPLENIPLWLCGAALCWYAAACRCWAT